MSTNLFSFCRKLSHLAFLRGFISIPFVSTHDIPDEIIPTALLLLIPPYPCDNDSTISDTITPFLRSVGTAGNSTSWSATMKGAYRRKTIIDSFFSMIRRSVLHIPPCLASFTHPSTDGFSFPDHCVPDLVQLRTRAVSPLVVSNPMCLK